MGQVGKKEGRTVRSGRKRRTGVHRKGVEGRIRGEDRWPEEILKGRKKEDARARRAGEGRDAEKCLRVSVVTFSSLHILRIFS